MDKDWRESFPKPKLGQHKVFIRLTHPCQPLTSRCSELLASLAEACVLYRKQVYKFPWYRYDLNIHISFCNVKSGIRLNQKEEIINFGLQTLTRNSSFFLLENSLGLSTFWFCSVLFCFRNCLAHCRYSDIWVKTVAPNLTGGAESELDRKK